MIFLQFLGKFFSEKKPQKYMEGPTEKPSRKNVFPNLSEILNETVSVQEVPEEVQQIVFVKQNEEASLEL